MITKCEITFEENPTDAELQILGDGLDQYTKSKVGGGHRQSVTFFLRDDEGKIVGGVHGNYGTFGWLYISMLWVSERLRGGGYGARLLRLIEDEAIRHGCVNAYLDTFSFQAPEFYQRLGYTVFGELKDFPIGQRRIFLRKNLSETDSQRAQAEV